MSQTVLLVGCPASYTQSLPGEALELRATDWRDAVETPTERLDVIVVGSTVQNATLSAQQVARRFKPESLIVATPERAVAQTLALLKVTPYIPPGVQVVAESDESVGLAIQRGLVRAHLSRTHGETLARAATALSTARPPRKADASDNETSEAWQAVLAASDYARAQATRAAEYETRERLFTSVVESSSDAILSASRDGFITSWNNAAERLFGYSKEEAIGASLDIVTPPDRRHEVAQILDRVAAGEAVQDFESVRCTRGGEPVQVALTVSPLRDNSSVLIGSVGIVRDIGPRLRVMRELRERTVQLERAHGDLKRTIEELQRSNRDLEHFAYLASHDLQEPLRMVTAYLALVERKCAAGLDDNGVKYIRYATDGARRMKVLIDNLLAYSRVDAAGAPFESCNLTDVLTAALSDLDNLIREGGASIHSEALPHVFGDPSQLGQVFSNLLANAIKFRGTEAPRVQISVAQQGGFFHLSVADNGIGFEASQAERIFKMFQRLHDAGKIPGTGLGLALTRRIIERHGGRIWAESEPGKGSRFCFTLPVTDAHSRSPDDKAERV